mmetsp:Transcript_3131/g.4413  ORF Transcript_3131/g.4413 Transcript_3131/m.4413 type:complete len:396 (-) Transcript_3131:137-1324(-)|eukprot:CAMPEP_0194080738 /NCGR_PEP_ID=MMETSP0149-20130528/6683_1 /TAXON_ID=122233 /ORGANISM="Chaetoceros debilis, Strain MM31A-1" /LENGTH=395 /DNA_ID=CAMNT_0038762517 /DNA_START=144 /DNA_END=1331 /DNA_ORIENTATION=+
MKFQAIQVLILSSALSVGVQSFAPTSQNHCRLSSASCSGIISNSNSNSGSSSYTTLLNQHHQFSGFDAGRSAEVSWTPSEAAEFVIWHVGEPSQAGMQLSPMIRGWSGIDVGEFLTRLFLGEVDDDEKRISFCPSNVREPKWKGLDEEGNEAMKDLLLAALPNDVLSAAELARCGQSFLLKEHRWPSVAKDGEAAKGEYEMDSFASMGYSADFAKTLGSVRRERMDEFTPKDVVEMLSLREHDKDSGYFRLSEFWANLGIKMTPGEKVETVEGMALSGWAPSNIAQFIGVVEDIDERIIVPRVNIVASMGANEQEATSEQAKEGEGDGEASETMQAYETVSETASKLSSTSSSSQETTLPAPNASALAAAANAAAAAVVTQPSDSYPVKNMFGSS